MNNDNEDYQYSEIEILEGLIYKMELQIIDGQRKLSSGNYRSEQAVKSHIEDYTKIKSYLEKCLVELEGKEEVENG